MTYGFLENYASIKSEDGNVLPMFKSYFAFQPSGLPGNQLVLNDVAEMIKILKKLKKAQKADHLQALSFFHLSQPEYFSRNIRPPD